MASFSSFMKDFLGAGQSLPEDPAARTQAEIKNRLKATKKQKPDRRAVVVFGLGQFGTTLVKQLQDNGVQVLGIDVDPQKVQSASKFLDHVVCADATKTEVFNDLGIEEFSKAFVAIAGDLAASVLIVSSLAKIGGIEIWAKAADDEQGTILQQLGVAPAHIFYPNKDIARRAARLLIQAFEDYIELGYGYALVKMTIPHKYVGFTLRDLAVVEHTSLSVLATLSAEGQWQPARGSTVLKTGQTVLVVGKPQDLSKLTAA
ncbi:MAG: TrkA family potassium uptake protein [Actinomycetaceae bacterium]|nr:TrkA family potassium uptake protein [Actinomycetaceae bacterium]